MPRVDYENSDLYAILGVDRDAPSGLVHEAFIKLLPKHHPEKDKEGFKAIYMAFRTLMDPRAREEYDSLHSCGGDIASNLNSAYASIFSGRLKRAEALARGIVEETGESSEALMLLGQVQHEQGHFRDAIQTISRLVEKYPRVPLYHLALGGMLADRYHALDDTNAQDHALKRAREQFEIALELDSSSPFPYLEIGNTYFMDKVYERAFEWTDKAAMANGRLDFEDLDALLLGFQCLALLDDDERIHTQVLRIEDVIPSDKEIVSFAVARIVHVGILLIRQQKYEHVRTLLLAAMRITNDKHEIRDLEEVLRDTDMAIDIHEVWDDFMQDTRIIKPVRDMAGDLMEHFLLKISTEELDIRGQKFIQSLETWDRREIRRSIGIVKTQYPAVWKLNHQLWQSLESLTGGISRGSGCIVPPWVWGLITIVAIIRFIMMLFKG